MSRVGSRALVSLVMVTVHLCALAHLALDRHTLSAGEVVHCVSGDPRHAHGAADSVCNDVVQPDVGACDAFAVGRAGPLPHRPVLSMTAHPWAALGPSEPVEVPVRSAPLTWAPKASPPTRS